MLFSSDLYATLYFFLASGNTVFVFAAENLVLLSIMLLGDCIKLYINISFYHHFSFLSLSLLDCFSNMYTEYIVSLLPLLSSVLFFRAYLNRKYYTMRQTLSYFCGFRRGHFLWLSLLCASGFAIYDNIWIQCLFSFPTSCNLFTSIHFSWTLEMDASDSL